MNLYLIKKTSFLLFLFGLISMSCSAQWKEIHSPNLEKYNLFDLHKNGDTLVAVGYIADGFNSTYRSVILTSIDNGGEWEESFVEGRFMKTMDFNRDGIGFMGGLGLTSTSYVMKSTDGGLTWQDHFTDASTTGITDIKFLNNNIGVASGYGSMQFATPNLYETRDGGESWQVKLTSSPEFTTFDQVEYIGTDAYALSSVYFSGSVLGNEMCYSSDSGATWIQIVEHDENLGGMAWLTATTGFIVTEGGSIQKSTDGGVNWSEIHNTNGTALFGISMNDSVGFAIGAEGLILKTSDQGESWKKQTTGTSKNISGIIVLNDRSFALGQDGLILQLGGDTGGGTGEGGDDDGSGGSDPGDWSVGVDEVAKVQYQIYPNPASMGQINVDISGGVILAGAQLSLVNIIGQTCYNSTLLSNQQSLDISALPAGIYVVNIQSLQGRLLHQQKLIIK